MYYSHDFSIFLNYFYTLIGTFGLILIGYKTKYIQRNQLIRKTNEYIIIIYLFLGKSKHLHFY